MKFNVEVYPRMHTEQEVEAESEQQALEMLKNGDLTEDLATNIDTFARHGAVSRAIENGDYEISADCEPSERSNEDE